MAKYLIIAATLLLSACAMPGVLPPPVTTGGAVVAPTQVQRVIAQARQICSYEPTFQTVANIISAFGVPAIGGLAAVADSICQAVTTLPLADGPGDRRPRVGGVIVRGRFVKR